MLSDNIVFTAYNSDRDYFYTLTEGTPETVGYEHIVDRRPFMKNKKLEIKKALKKQTVAIKDKRHENRERVYSKGTYSDNCPDMYMAVVVEYNETNNNAQVITAWPSATVTEGDIVYVKSEE